LSFEGINVSMAQGARGEFETATGSSPFALRSSRVVTAEGVAPATLVVESGKITAVLEQGKTPGGIPLRDFGDAVLLPGLIDTHVHINEPGRTDWEGFVTATQAAASGGVTTVVDMPLNCIPETISVDALEAKRAAAGRAGEPDRKTWVDWMAWGGVVGHSGMGGNEAELPALIAAGIPGFKCFQVHSGIDGFAWVDEAQLRKSLAVLRGTGLPLLAHAEVGGPVERATAEIRSRTAEADWRQYRTYLSSRPEEAELDAIAMLIQLAEEFASPIHVVHLASAKALPMLREARSLGVHITVETCPQYLWFSAEDVPDGATEFKCAPPIRDAANREALWQALLDGTIDMIATDHSPCAPELKVRETGKFDQAWGGIASLGLALSVIWTGLLERTGTDMAEENLLRIAQWLSAGPAKLAGLTGRKGSLEVGSDADIVVFEPETRWRVSPADLHFRHKISPYLGADLHGRVVETFLRGVSVYGREADSTRFSPHAHGQELRKNL
jgi:allantoinase